MKPPVGNGDRCDQDKDDLAQTLASRSVGWVARLNQEGLIVEVSYALAETWHRAVAELLETPLWSHFPPTAHASLKELIHRANTECRGFHADVPCPGGRWWDVCLAPWPNDPPETQGLLFTAWDVTERKQSEESLRQAASASDKLRQCLSTINQCVELDPALALLVKSAVSIAGMDGGAVYLVEENEAVLRHHLGLDAEFIAKVSRRSLETGYINAALQETGEILDVMARFPQQNQLGAIYGLRHVYCIALVAEKTPFGLLLVAVRQEQPPSSSAVELVRLLALETESLFLRLKAEERLRRLSSQQRVILNTAPPGIAHIRREQVIWANAGHDLLLGYEPGESVGILVSDHVVDTAEYRRLGREADLEFARGGIYTTEVQMRTKSGAIFWCRLRGQTIDLSHLEEGAIWILEDISEHKRLEAVLRANEAFALATLNALTANICVLDQHGCILAANEAWRSFGQTAGLPATTVGVGANYLEVCDAAARSGEAVAAQFAAGIRAVLAGESSKFCLEYTCHSPTEKRWFLGTVTRFADTSPPRLVVAHENLTALKLAEEGLRKGQTRFEALFTQALVGAAQIQSASGELVQVNEKLCRMLGYTPPELLGMNFQALTHPEDREPGREAVPRPPPTGLNQPSVENRYLRKDGSIMWGRLRLLPLWSTGQEPDFQLALVEDITDQRRLEEQLRQAQKMESIGHLAGGMAHEFNNILAGMMLRLGLTQSASAPPESRALAQDLEVGCVRAADLVKQLLAFSRRSMMQQKPLDLRSTVANQVKLLQQSIGDGIRVEFDSPEALPLVKADKALIEQVLLNLCLNARDALKQGGSLRIELSGVAVGPEQAAGQMDARPGKYVCLSVIDNGSGMDGRTLQRLFEPFFTTKEIGQGTGLGLATVRGIVQQHQGWVEVESRVGQGSSFRVYLPALGRRAVGPAAP